jgi:hypothetical protein
MFDLLPCVGGGGALGMKEKKTKVFHGFLLFFQNSFTDRDV